MMKTNRFSTIMPAIVCAVVFGTVTHAAEDWTQFKGDALRSGNAPEVSLQTPVGLLAAIPLTDGIFTSPVISRGKVFVVDGSGVVLAIDTATLEVDWRFVTRGGPGNCNNVASPAVAGDYLHVATMA